MRKITSGGASLRDHTKLPYFEANSCGVTAEDGTAAGGYEHLLQDAPTLEAMTRFFRTERDAYERRQAEARARSGQ